MGQFLFYPERLTSFSWTVFIAKFYVGKLTSSNAEREGTHEYDKSQDTLHFITQSKETVLHLMEATQHPSLPSLHFACFLLMLFPHA